ncbi:cbb3-type cytochrome oxidase assembly protein CcoS [Lysobacter sp. H21R4]|uniref:cbb3-type cytochrome oxidase assembly protein CcoS n=1 Tax=Lysobacter sp. H21R4 TaxID=2781021 RepID=UPI00188905CE|nr:cbb3-type cytochrome oxidase assembly protein CcoS [Lysobacter sp. H21R4]QOY62429.1 cbb3-type cytochrome oxidase assembly protein CcoS [Lysobacter sp. H21R4]
MNILLFLIPVSMLGLGVALWAFIWAVKRGQFEDMDTPALDILREDEHDRPVAGPRTDKTHPPGAGTSAAAPPLASAGADGDAAAQDRID